MFLFINFKPNTKEVFMAINKVDTNPSCYLKKVIENAAINIINFRTNPRSVTA